MRILIVLEGLELEAELDSSNTAKAIYQILPIESSISFWGDEIYFPIDVSLPPENARDDLKIGDLAYWPDGRCFCIFYGRTPASFDDKPRPASPVTVFGRIHAGSERLKNIKADKILIEKLEDG
ncbi:MAG: cyclophilin-like fold protein [Methanobacteriota archaeon]